MISTNQYTLKWVEFVRRLEHEEYGNYLVWEDYANDLGTRMILERYISQKPCPLSSSELEQIRIADQEFLTITTLAKQPLLGREFWPFQRIPKRMHHTFRQDLAENGFI
jgi:hypothetical protein